MKRTSILFIILSVLLLVGCERPLRPEGQTPAPDATTPSEIPIDAVPTSELVMPTQPVGGEVSPTLEVPGEQPTVPPPTEGTVDPGAVPTATPAPDSPTPVPPGENPIHTVQAGEYLGTIAAQYGVTVEAIVQANNLANPDSLKIGDQLIIPLTGTTEPPPAPTTPPTTTEIIHIVVAGENLYRISLLYGVTVDQIVQYNGLANPDRIEVGQEIKIPPTQ